MAGVLAPHMGVILWTPLRGTGVGHLRTQFFGNFAPKIRPGMGLGRELPMNDNLRKGLLNGDE